MLFDTINHLLFEKKKDQLDVELLEFFDPYMTMRYFSACDTEYVNYVNDTLNIFQDTFDTEEDKFSFYENIIPKLRFRRIDYPSKKKQSDKKPKNSEAVKLLPEFYSKREMEYIDKL
jgi:hypothetical protein